MPPPPSEPGNETAGYRIVREALNSGGKDNISIITMELLQVPEE
jgi:serine/threonine protein phosphatase PrpC